MAGPILASTYKRWRVLIAKAEQEPALVDVLDFSDFSDVHGHGALEEIFPVVKGIHEPPPRIPHIRSKGALVEGLQQPTVRDGEHRKRDRRHRVRRSLCRVASKRVVMPRRARSFLPVPRRMMSVDPSMLLWRMKNLQKTQRALV